MPRFTVVCEYHRTYYNTVTVDADTPEAACALAVEEANMDDGWDDYDDVGDTYVGQIRPAAEDEGAPDEDGVITDPFDNNGWDDANTLAVPEEFRVNKLYTED